MALPKAGLPNYSDRIVVIAFSKIINLSALSGVIAARQLFFILVRKQ